MKDKMSVHNFEREGTFNREVLDSLRKYRGHNLTNCKNWLNEVEPFKFSYDYPSLDWYITINVEIKWDDFDEFTLERRCGPFWWLIGSICYEKADYKWDSVSIGEIRDDDLIRFIEWTKKRSKNGLSPIKTIKCLFGQNLFDEIDKINKLIEKHKEENEDEEDVFCLKH